MARRTKQDADATRSRLLDAAEQVFYDKGVSRASLNDIACAAGATRGAIYWHFKDKGDLFNAMMDRATSPLQKAVHDDEAFSRAKEEPLQRLRDRIDYVLRSISTDARTCRVFEIALFRVEYVDELASARDRHMSECGSFQQKLKDDLQDAAAAQGITLPQGAQCAAIGLRSVFEGLMQIWLLNPADFDLVAVSRTVVDAYLKGLGFRL
ncbi:TetR family transcriptional regulator [Acidovorax sp. Leaf160]|uniref:TetR family transcriptional regulator n=1 Tax=Acidovorax sp. Leaf160 TaxID=1736280 RepID=UPI0006F8D6D4|nr:TetR family transcriptional regulator [Acidovorax sp. Leaf160]KQR60297.1 TetR family transcriptional regulator [Acidovorax sp. Leaf160]